MSVCELEKLLEELQNTMGKASILPKLLILVAQSSLPNIIDSISCQGFVKVHTYFTLCVDVIIFSAPYSIVP